MLASRYGREWDTHDGQACSCPSSWGYLELQWPLYSGTRTCCYNSYIHRSYYSRYRSTTYRTETYKRINAFGGLLVLYPFVNGFIANVRKIHLSLPGYVCNYYNFFGLLHLRLLLTVHQLGLIALSADSIVVANLGAGRHQWNVTVQSVLEIFRVSFSTILLMTPNVRVC